MRNESLGVVGEQDGKGDVHLKQGDEEASLVDGKVTSARKGSGSG